MLQNAGNILTIFCRSPQHEVRQLCRSTDVHMPLCVCVCVCVLEGLQGHLIHSSILMLVVGHTRGMNCVGEIQHAPGNDGTLARCCAILCCIMWASFREGILLVVYRQSKCLSSVALFNISST
jgi:hypothetical protein